jgi:SAM-dependent methyltransferase
MGLQELLKPQYERTMEQAYAFARAAARAGDQYRDVLDCGSSDGHEWRETFREGAQAPTGLRYTGLEWHEESAALGRSHGLDIVSADLNERLPLADASQDRVIAYSVVEHLLMPCRFMTQCHRVLRPGGKLVILTPNISTYFTALLVLAGKMPSSGPHPDSASLVRREELVRVTGLAGSDVEHDRPEHRHLIVFSYSVLRRFLEAAGFEIEASRGFGYYPLPRFIQPVFERLDPWHCHQMVFVCRRKS